MSYPTQDKPLSLESVCLEGQPPLYRQSCRQACTPQASLTALAVTVTFQLGGNLRSHAIQPLSLLSCLAAGHHQEANIIINELCKREAGEFCDILNICLIARDGNLDECKITGNTAWIEGRVWQHLLNTIENLPWWNLTLVKREGKRISGVVPSLEITRDLNRNCNYLHTNSSWRNP